MLVAVCCLYLACKIEECPQYIQAMCNHAAQLFQNPTAADLEGHQQPANSIHGRRILNNAGRDNNTEANSFAPVFQYTHQRLADMEFYLLESLGFQTVVFHPYRPLKHFVDCLKLQDSALLRAAWYLVPNGTSANHLIFNGFRFIVNDTYYTSIPLRYAPHVIAIAAMMIAAGTMEDEAVTQAVEEWIGALADVSIKDVRIDLFLVVVLDWRLTYSINVSCATLRRS